VAAGDGRLTAEELDTAWRPAVRAHAGELAELTATCDTDRHASTPPRCEDLLVIDQKGGHTSAPGLVVPAASSCGPDVRRRAGLTTPCSADTLRIDADMPGKADIVPRRIVMTDN